MSFFLWILGVIVGAIVSFYVEQILEKFGKIRFSIRLFTSFAAFILVLFLFLLYGSFRARDVARAWLLSNSTDRHCFFDTKILTPKGANLENDAALYEVRLDTKITWDPDNCVMVVQAYKDGTLLNELKGQKSGDATIVQATEGRIGVIEIKLFRTGFLTSSNNVWVKVTQ